MGQRTVTTARQRRLGTELRKMRERAGLNAAQASEAMGLSRTRVSNIETGRLGMSEDRLRTLANIYSCTEEAYIDALVAMAQERLKGWWESYRGTVSSGLLDLAELEHHAVSMRSVQMTHLPGLLQTEGYAKALLSMSVPKPPAVQLRRWLSFRMRRRDVLDRDDPPPCDFLIHEAALRMEYGDTKVTRGQLDHLLEESERDNVTVRVVPFAAGGFPHGSSSTLMYASGPVPQLDTVQLDVANGIQFVDSEPQLANYRTVLDWAEEKSLSPGKSRDFILGCERQP